MYHWRVHNLFNFLINNLTNKKLFKSKHWPYNIAYTVEYIEKYMYLLPYLLQYTILCIDTCRSDGLLMVSERIHLLNPVNETYYICMVPEIG